MINFYFVLDKTYKLGTYDKVKEALKQGKSVKQYLNDKPTSVYVATTFLGKYLKQNCGIKILARDFDSTNQRIKKSHMDYAQLNMILHDFKYRLEQEIKDRLLKRQMIRIDEVKGLMYSVVTGTNKNSRQITFISAFDEFIEERKRINKPKTIVKFNATRKLLLEFEKVHKQIQFDSINKEFEKKFRDFCIHTKKHLNNTISKNLKVLKTFLKWAFDMEYINNLEFTKFDTREDDLEVIHLTSTELKSLEELRVDNIRLREILDVFLFQLYTGQRFGDVINMKYKSIEKSDDGQYYWRNFQLKGKKNRVLRIPLSSKALNIVERYKNDFTEPEDFVLPHLSNPTVNFHIKQICKKAKINDMVTIVHFRGSERIEESKEKWATISTHAARRSFITLSLERQMVKETIMQISGHQDVRAMKPYIRITEKFYTDEFKKAWD